jgi:type IV secretory pathway TrbF-like protein
VHCTGTTCATKKHSKLRSSASISLIALAGVGGMIYIGSQSKFIPLRRGSGQAWTEHRSVAGGPGKKVSISA